MGEESKQRKIWFRAWSWRRLLYVWFWPVHWKGFVFLVAFLSLLFLVDFIIRSFGLPIWLILAHPLLFGWLGLGRTEVVEI
jgi:hypothetical protein